MSSCSDGNTSGAGALADASLAGARAGGTGFAEAVEADASLDADASDESASPVGSA